MVPLTCPIRSFSVNTDECEYSFSPETNVNVSDSAELPYALASVLYSSGVITKYTSPLIISPPREIVIV